MKHRYLAGALAASLTTLSVVAFADEMAVIVNKANSQAVNPAAVAKIYSGEILAWENGNSIVIVDQGDSPTSAKFLESIGKSYSNRVSAPGMTDLRGAGLKISFFSALHAATEPCRSH